MKAPRILVIRGGAIGDFILTLPAIRLLRENFPDCHLEILGYRQIAALADGRYYADATRSLDYGPMAGFFNPRAEQDPELSEYFSGFQQIVSYIYDPDGLFESCLRKAGVKNLIVGSPKVDDSSHAAHQLARPMEKLALWLENPGAEVFPSASDRAAADRRLAGRLGPQVVVHPGSGGEHKNWPVASWRRLIEKFPPERLILVGGESDGPRLMELRDGLSREVLILETLPLPELAAVLGRAAVFIGHDSGISHLAAAAGAPCVLLFGPTDPAVWAPAHPGTVVVQAPDGDLSRLEVSEVWRKITERDVL